MKPPGIDKIALIDAGYALETDVKDFGLGKGEGLTSPGRDLN